MSEFVAALIGAVIAAAVGWPIALRVARKQVRLERQHQTIEALRSELNAAEAGFHEPHSPTHEAAHTRATGLLDSWHHINTAGLLARLLPSRYSDLKIVCEPLADVQPTNEQYDLMLRLRDGSQGLHPTLNIWMACMPPVSTRSAIATGLSLVDRHFSEP